MKALVSPVRHPPVLSSEARVFCGASLLFVAGWLLFLSWMPFEWDLSGPAIGRRLTQAVFTLESHRLLARVTLLALFGALLGLTVPGRRGWCVAAALLFCLGLELSQALVFNRHARAGDLLVAMLAASLGLVLAPRAVAAARRLRRNLLPLTARGVTLCLAAVVVWCAFAAPALESFAGWNRHLPLLLGSEPAGKAPWEGCITRVTVAPGIGAPGAPLGEPAGAVRLASDPTGCLIPGPGVTESQARLLAESIMAARAFTVHLQVQRYANRQRGPARIVTQSASRSQRNFMLGQDGNDLVVRVRTPVNGDNGALNQAVWTDVFAGTAPLDLVVRYRDGHVHLSVDGGPLTPPDHLENITLVPMAALGQSPLWLSMLVFVPFGFYRRWSAAPTARRWRDGAAGLGLFLLAVAGAWSGARYWGVPFHVPLLAALAILLVPLLTSLTERLMTSGRMALCEAPGRE